MAPIPNADTPSEGYSTTKSSRQPKTETWITTNTAIIDRVPSWPEEARGLKKRTWITYVYSIGDIILVLLPLYFIFICIAVIKLNGKPAANSSFGTNIEFAINLNPTIFPIVFAAIIGRSMKMIARFMAEKGARIATLELLMASHSTWGTLESQLLMQKLTLVGVNLLFLWALSPLGGQASLRLMQRGTKTTYQSSKLRYMITGPAATAWGLASAYTGSGKFADSSALYTSALMAPLATKLGPQDNWGNVKIPMLETVSRSPPDSDGWFSVNSNISSPEAYSSLVGIPVVGLSSNDDSNFNLQYTYLTVNCENFSQAPYPGLDDNRINATKLEELAPGQVWYDKSENNPFQAEDNSTQALATFYMDTTRSFPWGYHEGADHDLFIGRLDGFFGNYKDVALPKAELTTNRELMFVSHYIYSPNNDGNTSSALNIAKCSLAQEHIEAIIQCQGTQCATTKVRKSQQDSRPISFTGFEHGTIISGFVTQFPRAVSFTAGSSPTERFLSNTSTFPFYQKVGQMTTDELWVDLALVPTDVFSKRLTLAMNTFYQLSVQSTGYFGNLPNNLSVYGPDTNTVSDINAYLPANLSATEHTFTDWYETFEEGAEGINSPFIGATTTANVTATQEIFVCNAAWLALLLVSSIIIS